MPQLPLLNAGSTPGGHRKSLVIYDEPECVLHPASWLVSCTHDDCPFPEHTGAFFR